jgi:hypothetical protein
MDYTTLILFGGSVDLSLWVGAFRALDKFSVNYPRIVATGTASPFAALLASGYTAEQIGKHWVDLINKTPRGALNSQAIENWLRLLLEAKKVVKFADLRGRDTPELKLIVTGKENRTPLTIPDEAARLGLKPLEIEVAKTVGYSIRIHEATTQHQFATPPFTIHTPGVETDLWSTVRDLVKPETKPLYLYAEPVGRGPIRRYVSRIVSPGYRDIVQLDEQASRVPFRLLREGTRVVGLTLPDKLRIDHEIVSKNAERDLVVALSDLQEKEADAKATLETNREVGEGTTVQRYPEIKIGGKVARGQELTVRVDLRLTFGTPKAVDALIIDGLDPDWQKISIFARLIAPFLIFPPGKEEGHIEVRNGKASIPLNVTCHVQPDLPQAVREFDLIVNLFYEGRYLGSTTRVLKLDEDLNSNATEHAESQESKTIEETTAYTKAIYIQKGAPTPKLTVMIHHPRGTKDGFLEWYMRVSEEVSEACPGLPAKMIGDTDLGPAPKDFAKGLMKALEEKKAGEHMEVFEGLGQKIYEKSPQVFKDVYWSMVTCFGQTFPIQFVTDDPYVPWEFMQPAKDDGIEAKCLAVNHPVARWLIEYESKRRTRLAAGLIVTIAPNYPSGWNVPPLPAAKDESDEIVAKFSAKSIPGLRPEVLRVFEDGLNEQVSILHFAGHGQDLSDPENASILLEKSKTLTVLEVRRPATVLGKKRGSLAFFNVCRAATIGESLGTVGGWAEALINKNFSGFIAPMWAIYDQNAKTVTTEFLDSITNQTKTVAEALRQIREEYGDRSPTYLSYIYYGDVMARLS